MIWYVIGSIPLILFIVGIVKDRISYNKRKKEGVYICKKDMGINPKTPDGNFKKLSVILDEVSKYFNTNCSQYSNNVKENMKEVFPKEGQKNVFIFRKYIG